MTTESDNTALDAKPVTPAEPEAKEPQPQEGAPVEGEQSSEAPPPEAAADGPDELKELAAERDKFREQLLRTAADFDNFRKRTRRELDESKMRGKDDAVRDLLPVFDNLERAVSASENATDVASVLEGVRMVLKMFQDTAERMGLNRVQTEGARFDPNLHEAIQQVESDEHPPGTIVREVMPGYMFGKRLIRAAMVVVARAPAKQESDAAESKPSVSPRASARPSRRAAAAEAETEAQPETEAKQEPAQAEGAEQPPASEGESPTTPPSAAPPAGDQEQDAADDDAKA